MSCSHGFRHFCFDFQYPGRVLLPYQTLSVWLERGDITFCDFCALFVMLICNVLFVQTIQESVYSNYLISSWEVSSWFIVFYPAVPLSFRGLRARSHVRLVRVLEYNRHRRRFDEGFDFTQNKENSLHSVHPLFFVVFYWYTWPLSWPRLWR